MEYKFEDLSLELSKDCAKGKIMANGKRLLEEAKVDDEIKPNLTISVYPKEYEPPHFLISTHDNQSCRFDLKTFKPIDEMPRDIKNMNIILLNFLKKKKIKIR